MSKRLPKSVRKFIRKEKGRLRRQFLNFAEREEKIKELLEKVRGKYNGKDV